MQKIPRTLQIPTDLFEWLKEEGESEMRTPNNLLIKIGYEAKQAKEAQEEVRGE